MSDPFCELLALATHWPPCIQQCSAAFHEMSNGDRAELAVLTEWKESGGLPLMADERAAYMDQINTLIEQIK